MDVSVDVTVSKAVKEIKLTFVSSASQVMPSKSAGNLTKG
jgi:hypothetical protein